MKELREAKGFTHKDLAARINDTLKKWLESALREQGKDMRSAWRQRDAVLERVRVSAETVERWEKVGFGVQRGTRAAHKFYSSPAFVALGEVLDASPDDMDKEMSNRTLQPGDSVVRPIAEGRNPVEPRSLTPQPWFDCNASHLPAMRERLLFRPGNSRR